MAHISDKVRAQLEGKTAHAVIIVTLKDAHAPAAAPGLIIPPTCRLLLSLPLALLHLLLVIT